MDDDPTIAAFARDLQDAAAATPAPAVGASLAAVLDGRAPTAVYPEVVLPGRARPARRPLRLRWAVASAAFAIGAGSLGVAGALPGPVQRQVSRMAEVVGVDLPDGRPTTTTSTPMPPTVPPSTSVPPRPTVVPADEPPVTPATSVADDPRPDDRGRDDRGRDDERDDDEAEDELESSGPGGGPTGDRGPDTEVIDDDDRSGPDPGDEPDEDDVDDVEDDEPDDDGKDRSDAEPDDDGPADHLEP